MYEISRVEQKKINQLVIHVIKLWRINFNEDFPDPIGPVKLTCSNHLNEDLSIIL